MRQVRDKNKESIPEHPRLKKGQVTNMEEAVLVAILSLVGTLGGSLGGILTANKLTNYRIQQLENKVEKHNKVVERVYILEKNEELIEKEIDQLRRFHDGG